MLHAQWKSKRRIIAENRFLFWTSLWILFLYCGAHYSIASNLISRTALSVGIRRRAGAIYMVVNGSLAKWVGWHARRTHHEHPRTSLKEYAGMRETTAHTRLSTVKGVLYCCRWLIHQVHHGLQKLEELVSNINDIIENRWSYVGLAPVPKGAHRETKNNGIIFRSVERRLDTRRTCRDKKNSDPAHTNGGTRSSDVSPRKSL